jgi:glycosyltransferase 2 family protein
MLPISNAGWGVREATMMVAFGYALCGACADGWTVVSILFGAVYFIVGGLGGLVWISSAEKTPASMPIAGHSDI